MNYTYLHYADCLPTVGILQKLLIRSGAKLDADGLFGRKTLMAVQHFQRLRNLKPDGIVGKKTWPRLTEGLSLPIFDCVDIFDAAQKEALIRARKKKAANAMPDSNAAEADDIRAVGGSPFIVGGMSNGVEQAITMICHVARNAMLMRFHGHGYAGSFAIGAGSGGPNQYNRINAGSLPKLSGTILRLKSIFGSYGSMQLMSCDTAQGRDGKQLLATLASLVEVPVTAGIQVQYGGDGIATFKLEGPTVTALPNGQSLKDWCQALPDF